MPDNKDFDFEGYAKALDKIQISESFHSRTSQLLCEVSLSNQRKNAKKKVKFGWFNWKIGGVILTAIAVIWGVGNHFGGVKEDSISTTGAAIEGIAEGTMEETSTAKEDVSEDTILEYGEVNSADMEDEDIDNIQLNDDKTIAQPNNKRENPTVGGVLESSTDDDSEEDKDSGEDEIIEVNPTSGGEDDSLNVDDSSEDVEAGDGAGNGAVDDNFILPKTFVYLPTTTFRELFEKGEDVKFHGNIEMEYHIIKGVNDNLWEIPAGLDNKVESYDKELLGLISKVIRDNETIPEVSPSVYENDKSKANSIGWEGSIYNIKINADSEDYLYIYSFTLCGKTLTDNQYHLSYTLSEDEFNSFIMLIGRLI